MLCLLPMQLPPPPLFFKPVPGALCFRLEVPKGLTRSSVRPSVCPVFLSLFSCVRSLSVLLCSLGRFVRSFHYAVPVFLRFAFVFAAAAAVAAALPDDSRWWRLLNYCRGGVRSLSFSPDGRFLAISMHEAPVHVVSPTPLKKSNAGFPCPPPRLNHSIPSAKTIQISKTWRLNWGSAKTRTQNSHTHPQGSTTCHHTNNNYKLKKDPKYPSRTAHCFERGVFMPAHPLAAVVAGRHCPICTVRTVLLLSYEARSFFPGFFTDHVPDRGSGGVRRFPNITGRAGSP